MTGSRLPAYLRVREEGGRAVVLLRIKAVPGASASGVAGVVGDRLKVRVAAPPEGGRANRAIVLLLASVLGVRRGRVRVESGEAGEEKTVAVEGVDPRRVAVILEGM